MNEHSFIKSVHRALDSQVYAWKTNVRFNNGIPDAWYSGPAGDVWVEYKWLPKTPTRHFTPSLSALQRKWLNDRHQEGRTVAVIVGCPDGAVILENGAWNHQVNCRGLQWTKRCDVAKWIEATTLSSSTAVAD